MTSSLQITDRAEGAHSCECANIHRCAIFAHSDAGVQNAIANLADEMARYDDESGAESVLIFRSQINGKTFSSETLNTKARLTT